MDNLYSIANTEASRLPQWKLTVIVPVFNEERVLPMFHERLKRTFTQLQETWEVIYIDDGSTDDSYEILQKLQSTNPNVGLARFTRNFGKEEAMTAGLRLATGDAIVVIDSDLQDPPELIPLMIDAWRDGADIVNMRRRRRHGESWLKKVTAHLFYRLINRLSEVPVAEDVGDFRLLSRRAVDALNLLEERNRFMKGLFAWIGYRKVTIDYDRDARAAGETKWRYWRLWNFALEGITGFTIAPLKIATYIGSICAGATIIYAIYFLFKTMVVGEEVKGFPTLIVTVLILGGLQLMAVGIIGEYLGRLFIESKRRPLYLMEEYLPPIYSKGDVKPSFKNISDVSQGFNTP